MARAATEDEDQRETGGAKHEDQPGNARHDPDQGRRFDETEDRQGLHAEAGGKQPVFRRLPLKRHEKQPSGERQVEEDMGQKNAGQPVNADRLLQPQCR